MEIMQPQFLLDGGLAVQIYNLTSLDVPFVRESDSRIGDGTWWVIRSYRACVSEILSFSLSWVKAIGIGVPVLTATINGILTQKQIDTWYKDLKKPKWTPPNWAWIVIDYATQGCMGAASWFIWREGGFEDQKLPLTLYGVQLLLNWLHSPLFFHCHKMGLALIDSFLMNVAVTAATVLFFRESKTGGSLLIPYTAYACFCTAFTAQTMCLNQEDKTKKNPPGSSQAGQKPSQGTSSGSAQPSLPKRPDPPPPKVETEPKKAEAETKKAN